VTRVTERFRVEVAADQFQELCKPSQPLAAVLELIWNSLDAEANNVTVSIARTPLDAVEGVLVSDDGHGMPFEEANREFRTVGGSWKRTAKMSHNGHRTLHGKKGQGRFRAFALGRQAEWNSVAEGMNGLERVVVRGSLSDSEFVLDGPERIASGSTGTVVRTDDAQENTRPLLGDRARDALLVRLSSYLMRYPEVVIIYDGDRLNPAEVIDHRQTYELRIQPRNGDVEIASLDVIEWSKDIVGFQSTLLLCDANGVVLHEITNDIPGASRRVTANLTWRRFADFADRLELAEMDGDMLAPLIDMARDRISEHVRRREREVRQSKVEAWKSRKVYPYATPPVTSTERAERAVFDTVATIAADAIPEETAAARLSLRLIQESLRHSPGSLTEVLREVLNLTQEQLDAFAALLRNTSLQAIIETTALVTDRLNMIQRLEDLLFTPDGRTMVRERDHLHKILEQRAWIFGEEFTVTVSERTLTNVVRAHLALLGDEAPELENVSDASGSTRRRVDLMFSRTTNGPRGRRHLVVELKRPSHVLGQQDLTQITGYALALTADPAYRADEVEWEFWLVGDEYDDYVYRMSHLDQFPEGVSHRSGGVTIYVRRWAEVLEENRQRLHFYRNRLEFEPNEESAITDLLSELLPSPPADPSDEEASA
jgi:hypothetical protein